MEFILSIKIPDSVAKAVMVAAGLLPLVPYPGLGKSWLCKCKKCKRESTYTFASVRDRKSGCHYCEGRKTDITQAEAIMIAAKLKPLEAFRGVDYPWKCLCLVCKRETSPRYKGVKNDGRGCKYCAGNAVVLEEAVAFLISKNLKPLVIFPGAHKRWKSVCVVCNSEVTPTLSDMKQGHSGCKYCAAINGGKKQRLSSDPTKIQEILLTMNKANLEPLEEFKLSNSKWRCRCMKCGEIVFPQYDSIRAGSGGCNKCARVEQGKKSRKNEEEAKNLMLERNLSPLEPYPGAMKPWKSICLDCGNEVKPRYAHIQQGRKGCPFCGLKSTADKNRIPQELAFEIARKSGWEPLEPYISKDKPWLCRCTTCNSEITAHLSSMQAGFGCRVCSGLVVDPLAAIQVMEKAKLRPLTEYPGGNIRWECKCLKCNRIVFPRYSTIKFGIGGCKYCATHGYDFKKPGAIYLITNKSLNAHKIGITNLEAVDQRLKKHQKLGWETFKIEKFTDGNIAFDVEQSILSWWRNELEIPPYLSSSEMKQGGHTETINADEIDLPTIWRKVLEFARNYEPEQNRKPRKTTMPVRVRQITETKDSASAKSPRPKKTIK